MMVSLVRSVGGSEGPHEKSTENTQLKINIRKELIQFFFIKFNICLVFPIYKQHQ
jgi:hypothetical protein